MTACYREFRVAAGVREPRAKQLADHFRARIANGELAYGDVLPPAGSLANASRMTVLAAYRQLQREGLVRLQPSRGTVVIARQRQDSYAIVIGSEALAHGGRLNVNQLLASLIALSPAERQAPRMYMLRSPLAPTEDIDPYIPDQLREDIADGLIEGAFVYRPRYLLNMAEWFADRNVPSVSLSLSSQAPCVGLDIPGAVASLLREYHRQGLRRIEIWDTSTGGAYARAIQDRLSPAVWAELRFTWRACELDHPTVVATAQACTAACLAQAQLPDALIITDDWVGLTAALELAAAGIAIPARLRLGVFCNAGYIPQILACCDRFATDPDEQAKALYELMTRVVARQPWQPVSLPLQLTLSSPRNS